MDVFGCAALLAGLIAMAGIDLIVNANPIALLGVMTN